jgi:DNA modification methylase
MAKLAIADPPYWGTAERFYGLEGKGYEKGSPNVSNTHPYANLWDNPSAHYELLGYLQDNYDSFAIAMNTYSLGLYLKRIKLHSQSGYRVCAWIRPNSAPTGSRIRPSWEPVLVFNSPERRSYGSKLSRTKDYLIANPPRTRFIGQKPFEWTEWVIELLGYQDGDVISDLFPGSGAVTSALIELNVLIDDDTYILGVDNDDNK